MHAVPTDPCSADAPADGAGDARRRPATGRGPVQARSRQVRSGRADAARRRQAHARTRPEHQAERHRHGLSRGRPAPAERAVRHDPHRNAPVPPGPGRAARQPEAVGAETPVRPRRGDSEGRGAGRIAEPGGHQPEQPEPGQQPGDGRSDVGRVGHEHEERTGDHPVAVAAARRPHRRQSEPELVAEDAAAEDGHRFHQPLHAGVQRHQGRARPTAPAARRSGRRARRTVPRAAGTSAST